jgi:hypothetical protein
MSDLERLTNDGAGVGLRTFVKAVSRARRQRHLCLLVALGRLCGDKGIVGFE